MRAIWNDYSSFQPPCLKTKTNNFFRLTFIPTEYFAFIHKTVQHFLGSSDFRCKKTVATEVPSTYSTYSYPTTERKVTTSRTPIKPETTNPKIYSKTPICYPGALDSRCLSVTTKKIVSPSFIPPITTTSNLIISTIEAEPKCFPGMLNPWINIFWIHCKEIVQNILGSSDVRCKKLVTTEFPSIYSTYPYPTTERKETISRIPIKPETNTPKINSKAPICYPGALDPRCRSTITTERIISSSETPTFTTSIPNVPKGGCYPGNDWVLKNSIEFTNLISWKYFSESLDPSCNQREVQLRCDPGYPYDVRCPNPTPTATPPTYLPPKPLATRFTTSQTTEKVEYETTTYPSWISSTEKSIPTTIPTKFTARPCKNHLKALWILGSFTVLRYFRHNGKIESVHSNTNKKGTQGLIATAIYNTITHTIQHGTAPKLPR